MMKLRIKLIIIAAFISSYAHGQSQTYSHQRDIKGITEQWHKIILPDDVFDKVSNDFSDIRILGITASNDTIEAPYILRLSAGTVTSNQVGFKLLNTSHNDSGYYFTFHIPTMDQINQIKLNFAEKNFDWLVKIEGSQNQNEWFTIADNYRILSIKNAATDFQFTDLVFPNSKFRYYRLLIRTHEKPSLTLASIAHQDITKGRYRNYAIKKFNIKENKQTKQTEINVELNLPVAMCQLIIHVKDTNDYYRAATVKYLRDSIKTEKGWNYNYTTLTSGILNSAGTNEFEFASTTSQTLKILIDNLDNQPLMIDSIQLKGNLHELIARFTIQANYFLAYGNKTVAKPQYDIERFVNNIPETLYTLQLGNEQNIENPKDQSIDPLFKNKKWLWITMTLIILTLGWFSIKMMHS